MSGSDKIKFDKFRKFRSRKSGLPSILMLSSALAGCGGGSTYKAEINAEEFTGSDEVDPPNIEIPLDEQLETANLSPSNLNVPTEFSKGETSIGVITFSDEDPDTVTLNVTGTDAESFNISIDNELLIAETATNSSQEYFSIIITATDQAGLSTERFFELRKDLNVIQEEKILEIQLENVNSDVNTFGVFINENVFNSQLTGVEFAISFDPDQLNFAGSVNSDNSIISGAIVDPALDVLSVKSLIDLDDDGEKDTFLVLMARFSDIEFDFANKPIFSFEMKSEPASFEASFFTPQSGDYDTVKIASTSEGNQVYDVSEATYSVII